MKTVDFHEKNYDQILAVCSREAEKIDLVTPVNAQVRHKVYTEDSMTDTQTGLIDSKTDRHIYTHTDRHIKHALWWDLAWWSHDAEVEKFLLYHAMHRNEYSNRERQNKQTTRWQTGCDPPLLVSCEMFRNIQIKDCWSSSSMLGFHEVRVYVLPKTMCCIIKQHALF